MDPWHYAALGFFVSAIILGIISGCFRSERTQERVGFLVLLSCLGICVAIAYGILTDAFQFGVWLSLALAGLLGILLFICVVQMAEHG